jgi:MiaB/RimO family radical SAM methylthiotransferase
MYLPLQNVPSLSWVSDLANLKICILTFGCTYNEGDSHWLSAILTHLGYQILADPTEADVIILNTCIVIEKTERKMVRLIRDYLHRGKDVVVTGCLPCARREILDEFPQVRTIFPHEIHQASHGFSLSTAGPIAVIQIGPGCLGTCRYCITRNARGRIKSLPIDVILSRIREAVDGGAVEIRLTGQDLSAYGCDRNGPQLPSLLKGITQIPGFYRVRLGMMNPATLIPIAGNVAEIIRDEHFFSFVHLPVQSGSDNVLTLMERGYTTSQYLDLIGLFREMIPDITIATDFIAGFVGEREEDFKDTCILLKNIRPGMVNVTRYSFRPGSTASRDHELPDRIRKDRSRELVRIGYEILKEEKQKMVGRICKVIITEKVKAGTVMARTESYLGVVICDDLEVGKKYLAHITGERTHYLTGKVISADL